MANGENLSGDYEPVNSAVVSLLSDLYEGIRSVEDAISGLLPVNVSPLLVAGMGLYTFMEMRKHGEIGRPEQDDNGTEFPE